MRTLDPTRPVYVYRNIREGKKVGKPTYSMMQDGLVTGHTHAIMLRDVTFLVRTAGQERVIREGRKNVHAFVRGYIVDSAMGTDATGKLPMPVTYSPYSGPHFYAEDTVIRGARAAIVNQHGITIAYGYYGSKSVA